MKKFLKWFFIVIAILFAIYFVHSLITAKVYFNIYTAMKEKVENEDYFYAKLSSQSDETVMIENEIFVKDNNFVKVISYLSDGKKVILKLWQKYLPNKTDNEDGTGYLFIESTDTKQVDKFEYDPTAIEPENKMYRYQCISNMVIRKRIERCVFFRSRRLYIFKNIRNCTKTSYNFI